MDRRQLENNFFFKSVLVISSKIQTWGYAFSSSISHTVNMYLHLTNTNYKNKVLSLENQKLHAQLAVLKEIQKENTRLKNLMEFSQTKQWHTIFAQVIGRDPLSQYQLITINRGKTNGVKQNMPVITKDGFIGYVFRSQNQTAQVILLTDPHSAVLAIAQRSRVQGIVEGIGHNKAQLKYLKRKDDIKVGDIIVTARSYPNLAGGFPIGKISKITKETYGLTQEVMITPFINPSTLEEVLVVLQASPKWMDTNDP